MMTNKIARKQVSFRLREDLLIALKIEARKANKQDIKQRMDAVLRKLDRFDFDRFKEEMKKAGYPIREARASTGKLNGFYVTAKSGTEYKASEIGKNYTLAHIEKTHFKLHGQTLGQSYGKNIISGKGGFHL